MLNSKIKENQEWLQTSSESDSIKTKKDEFNTFVQPMMSKIYPDNMQQNMGGMDLGSMDLGGMTGMDSMSKEPTIDEVD